VFNSMKPIIRGKFIKFFAPSIGQERGMPHTWYYYGILEYKKNKYSWITFKLKVLNFVKT